MPLSKAQVQEAFELFDNDMSGFITPDEIKMVFKGLGIKVDEDEIVAKFDEDGDKKVDFEEFWKMMQHQQKEAEGPREVLAAFQAFNPSGSGEISKDDLKEVAKSICEPVTEQDINEIWQYCADNDTDEVGTSHFSFAAWRAVMDQMYNKRTSRGNAESYSDDNIKTHDLPPREDAIWDELEREEIESRDERIEQNHQKEVDMLERRGRVQAARLARERQAEEETRKPEVQGPSKTAAWRANQSMNDVVKEKMAKRKAILQKQLEEEKEQEEKEREQEKAVIAKIQERRRQSEAAKEAEEAAATAAQEEED